MNTSNIRFFKEDVKVVLPSRKALKEAINQIINQEGAKPASIVLIFCSDGFLRGLNKRFLNHDYETDVMAFGDDEASGIGGEVYISVDRVKENASTYQVLFLEELYRVIIHGILHLTGMEDDTNEKKREMHGREDKYLKELFLPINEENKH